MSINEHLNACHIVSSVVGWRYGTLEIKPAVVVLVVRDEELLGKPLELLWVEGQRGNDVLARLVS